MLLVDFLVPLAIGWVHLDFAVRIWDVASRKGLGGPENEILAQKLGAHTHHTYCIMLRHFDSLGAASRKVGGFHINISHHKCT